MMAPLLVLSGPSGVGKTTLANAWLARATCPIRRAVTATTREPRAGERHAHDYYFWSRERFEEAIRRDEMLEYATVHGYHYYGTPRDEVDRYRAAGTAVLLVIDVQGAALVRARLKDECRTVFLNAPSWDVLKERLANRGSEDPEKVARRLKSAQDELARIAEFDRVIVNDDLERAARELDDLLRTEFTTRGTTCSTN